MFLEEASWLRSELGELTLPARPRVLNVASSTERYRTVEQPHNESEVLAPLRSRGAEIVHLDMKEDVGVDLVVDLTDPDLDLPALAGTFDVVLATGLLQHFDAGGADRLCGELLRATGSGGHLVITTPERYRRTPDPVDHGYRPSPKVLLETLRRHKAGVEEVAAEAVPIVDSQYYKGVLSRSSAIPVKGRWLTMPGGFEQIRRLAKRWGWRETCVIVRCP